MALPFLENPDGVRWRPNHATPLVCSAVSRHTPPNARQIAPSRRHESLPVSFICLVSSSETLLSIPLDSGDLIGLATPSSPVGSSSGGDIGGRQSQGRALDCGNFRTRVFEPAARAIGRPDVTFHSLRHTGWSHPPTGRRTPPGSPTHDAPSGHPYLLNSYGHMAAGISEQAATAIDRAVRFARVPILRPPEQERVTELRR